MIQEVWLKVLYYTGMREIRRTCRQLCNTYVKRDTVIQASMD